MNRRHFASSVLVGGLLASVAFAGAAPRQEKVAHTTLKVGHVAPDFTLLDNKWKPVHLADYRGKKNVVLAFYVLAFTGG